MPFERSPLAASQPNRPPFKYASLDRVQMPKTIWLDTLICTFGHDDDDDQGHDGRHGDVDGAGDGAAADGGDRGAGGIGGGGIGVRRRGRERGACGRASAGRTSVVRAGMFVVRAR